MKNLNEKLFEAIRENKIDKVLELIEKGADIEARNKGGWTPLHIACSYGKTETALMLIEKGADIGARNNGGSTPLHYACAYGKTETALILIEKGADIEARNNGGETPLDWASEGLKEVLKNKIQNSKDIKENKTFETVIYDLLANNYRIEIEKCLTIAHLIKITVLGKKIECFLYNLNTNFDNQKEDCKAVIARLCKKM